MNRLSIIIPARNEEFLEKTILNILENATGDIEILPVLDGWLPDPQIVINDNRVRFLHNPESIGQRRAINQGAREATGNFFMKADAHCAFDKGFDEKLIKDCEYDWTVVPRMYNLDHNTWLPKLHKRTDYMYISAPDTEKPWRAQYYEGKEKDDKQRQPKNNKMIDDVMCIMGPCFFMHMDRFWELGGCDVDHGGWGQQGIEVALKAWISGGRMVVNKNTWFAHWFRGDVGFPYKLTNKEIQKARKYSQDIWLNDQWPLAKRKLSWVIEKFNPPKWKVEEKPKDDSELKWDKYIKPLVERRSGSVICLGNNTEYFNKRFQRLGYNTLSADKKNIPNSTFAVLTDFHYLMDENEINYLIGELKNKVKRVIITGDSELKKEYPSKPDLDTLKHYFSEWKKRNVLKGSKRYSILYANPVLG